MVNTKVLLNLDISNHITTIQITEIILIYIFLYIYIIIFQNCLLIITMIWSLKNIWKVQKEKGENNIYQDKLTIY